MNGNFRTLHYLTTTRLGIVMCRTAALADTPSSGDTATFDWSGIRPLCLPLPKYVPNLGRWQKCGFTSGECATSYAILAHSSEVSPPVTLTVINLLPFTIAYNQLGDSNHHIFNCLINRLIMRVIFTVNHLPTCPVAINVQQSLVRCRHPPWCG